MKHLVRKRTALTNVVRYIETQLGVIGARLAWVSVTQVKIGTVGAVSVARDSGDEEDIRWTGELVADITLAGAGGLDTGAPAANSWYAVHAIGDSTGINVPKAMLSLSATAPTLPAGYDVFRRVGWARRNGSGNFLKFNQTGNGLVRELLYDEAIAALLALNAQSATVFTAVSLAALMPPGTRKCFLGMSFNNSGVGGLVGDDMRLRPTGSTVVNGPFRLQPGILLVAPMQMPLGMTTNESQSIDYQVSRSTNTASIVVFGYTDEL